MSHDKFLTAGLLVACGAWFAGTAWAVAVVVLGAPGVVWLALMLTSGGVLLALWRARPLWRGIALLVLTLALLGLAFATTPQGWFLIPAVLLEGAAAALSFVAGKAKPPTAAPAWHQDEANEDLAIHQPTPPRRAAW